MAKTTSGVRNARVALALLGGGVMAAIAIAVLAVQPMISAHDREAVGVRPQTGGGHAPTQALLDVYNSLPAPADASLDQEAVDTGDELFASYWLKDSPVEVVSFYIEQLTKQGWTLESKQDLASDKKDDGTQATVTMVQFLKGDNRLTLGVAPNLNYPPLGQTHSGITIGPK